MEIKNRKVIQDLIHKKAHLEEALRSMREASTHVEMLLTMTNRVIERELERKRSTDKEGV